MPYFREQLSPEDLVWYHAHKKGTLDPTQFRSDQVRLLHERMLEHTDLIDIPDGLRKLLSVYFQTRVISYNLNKIDALVSDPKRLFTFIHNRFYTDLSFLGLQPRVNVPGTHQFLQDYPEVAQKLRMLNPVTRHYAQSIPQGLIVRNDRKLNVDIISATVNYEPSHNHGNDPRTRQPLMERFERRIQFLRWILERVDLHEVQSGRPAYTIDSVMPVVVIPHGLPEVPGVLTEQSVLTVKDVQNITEGMIEACRAIYPSFSSH